MSIHLLADQGDKGGISQLIANGANVNESDGAGEKPLHYAAIKGHAEVVAILIQSGADPNTQSDRGTTPLHDAARNGKLEAVILLLESGADVNSKDADNKNPIHHAIANGHTKVVVKLLEHHAQINNAAKDGITPLHLAASKGSIPILCLLVEKGAKLDARDHKGNTALSSIPLAEKKPLEVPAPPNQLLFDVKGLLSVANPANRQHQDDEHSSAHGHFSDVTFLVDGARMNAHRNIVHIRCPRIGKMFHAEIPREEIEIRDMASPVFHAILDWIYTEDTACVHQADPDLSFLAHLLHASDKFGLRPLKTHCEALLMQHVSTANITQIWADLRRNPNASPLLMQYCAHLIVRNWNLVGGKLGQEMSKEDVVDMISRLTVIEHKEEPVIEKELVPANSKSRGSPKPSRTSKNPPHHHPPTHKVQPSPSAPAPPVSKSSHPTHATPVQSTAQNLNPDPRLDGKNFRVAKGIVAGMSKHKFAWPFQQPVNPVQLGIPDYFDVIKHPMDLATLKKKLEDGKYRTANEFAHDSRLIFNNALTYNQPDSDIYFMSDTLLRWFNQKFATAEWDLNDASMIVNETPLHQNPHKKRKASALSPTNSNGGVSTPPSLPPSRAAEPIPRNEPPPRAMPAPPSHTPQSKPTPAPPVKAEVISKPRPQEMTFEEKKDLGEKMNRLNPHQLAKVVHIIHNSKPDAANKSAESDDIEIDMNDLDQATLRQLERYVNDCLDMNQREGGDRVKKHKKFKHRKEEQ